MSIEQIYTMVGFKDRHGNPLHCKLLKKEKVFRDPTKSVWRYDGRNIEGLLPFTILIGNEEIKWPIIREINDETVKKIHKLKNEVSVFMKYNLIENPPTQRDVDRLKEDVELTVAYLFDDPARGDIDGYYGGG